jgi:hypothetical protein
MNFILHLSIAVHEKFPLNLVSMVCINILLGTGVYVQPALLRKLCTLPTEYVCVAYNSPN